MRSTSAGELTLLHTPQRAEGAKVEIVRDGNTTDLTGRVTDITIDFSADERVATADVTFRDDYPEYATSSSLNPLVEGSSYNTVGGAWDPLLWSDHDIKIYSGVDSLGSEVSGSDLKLIFHGVLGDEVEAEMSQGHRAVSVHCRDLAKRLQDKFIVGEYVYGDEAGTAAVAVVQSILNDNFSWDTSASNYKKLHVDATAYTNCDFVVYPIKVGNCTVWEAINKVIRCTASDDIGFELRYHFLPSGDTSTKDNTGNIITVGSDGFYLCMLQVDQSTNSAADSIDVSTDEVHEESISVQDDTIRNSIYGKYIDRNTDEKMEVHRDNQTSISTFGQRDMVIGQVDVPYIDTYPEMWDLLGVALNALKDVPATDKFTVQHIYHIDPNDMIDTTNAQLYTGTSLMGVQKITHHLTPGGGPKTKQMFTSTITGVKDRITGQISDWLAVQGGYDPGQDMPPSVSNGQAKSTFTQDNQGNAHTETVLTVPVPPNAQIEYVEWRVAVQGEERWREEITTAPRLVLKDLPPSKVGAWLYRFKLQGGYR